MRLVNARTDRVVASLVEMAETRGERKRGLLGRAAMAPGAALVIVPCCAIHTVGMRFSIDVVFVDAHGRVKKMVRNLPPWRMAACPSARAVVEMPAGSLVPDRTLSIGDRLYVELAPQDAPPPVTWESVSAAGRA
jgi:uncharacterized membrane protein (UPF0127 family)